tara:strand:- start:332 stop:946 length:615 start_codon:yes stop_codon:yes gene_type:complete
MSGDVVGGKIRTIAFEGLDGSGKGTTIYELSKLIRCECWETPREFKEKRRSKIDELGETEKLLEFLIESYRKENEEIQTLLEADSGSVILLDRCWVTPAAVRSTSEVGNPGWVQGVLHPDVIFTIHVDEGLRQERILKRAGGIEELNDRERKTIEDSEFREGIQRAEIEMGCVPLRIRERSPEVVAMRALQNLLGRKEYRHHPV